MRFSVFYNHIIKASQQLSEDIDDLLNDIYQFGYNAVECNFSDFEENPSAFFSRIKDHALSVSCVCRYFNFNEYIPSDKEFDDFLSVVSFMHCRKVMCIPGFYEEKGSKIELAKFVDGLRRLCERAVKYNIVILIENYDNILSPCCTMDDIRYLLDEVDGLFCAFDTGNFEYSGDNIHDAFNLLSDRIKHLHVKDRSKYPILIGDEPGYSISGRILYPAPCLDGYVDIPWILNKLSESGYNDYLTVEHFGASDELEFIERSSANLFEHYNINME